MLGTVVADWVRPPVKKEIEYITVEKIIERVRVVTVIKEHPDGSKETTIIEDSETNTDRDSHYKEITTPVDKKWIVSLSAGPLRNLALNPTYTLGIQRRIIWGAYMGAYVRTDREIGISLAYNF